MHNIHSSLHGAPTVSDIRRLHLFGSRRASPACSSAEIVTCSFVWPGLRRNKPTENDGHDHHGDRDGDDDHDLH